MPNLSAIAATSDGGFAVVISHTISSESAELEVEFVNRTGEVTASSIVARGAGFAATVVPHPLGAAVFWLGRKEINEAVVRSDGTIETQNATPVPDLQLWGVTVAVGGGEVALLIDTLTEPWIGPPAPVSGPPVLTTYAMRMSNSLVALDAPVKLAPAVGVSSRVGPIVFTGDAFVAAWSEAQKSASPDYAGYFDRHSRVLRIPLAGPIDPSASRLLELGLAGRRRSVNR